ncbi:MAG: hypothetical protein Q9213_008000 [Squamulea squamosa]
MTLSVLTFCLLHAANLARNSGGAPGVGIPSGGSFFMGNFFRIIREPIGQPLRRWNNEVPHQGMIRYLDFFNRERLLVLGSRALTEVLIQKPYDFTKPPQFARGIGNILGVGLFFAEGDEHKRQRKSLLPAFSYRCVKDFSPMFWSKSQELVHSLGHHISMPGNEDIDVDDWVSRATLDVIGLATFGNDFNTIQAPFSAVAEAYRTILSPGRWSQMLGFLRFFLPEWVSRLIPIQQTSEITQAINYIKGLCRQEVKDKKHQDILCPWEPHDRNILSIAASSSQFSTDDLVNQLMTFLIAGHETITAAMGWSIYEFCRDPEIQQRLRTEIRTHIPSQHFYSTTTEGFGVRGEGKFEARFIDRCTYLHAFCSEILRLYPPIPLTMRVATHDTSIMGTFIPKGTTIILAPWATNASIAIWGEDAHLFKPERWLNTKNTLPSSLPDSTPGLEEPLDNTRMNLLERHKTVHPESAYSFMTFLHGPRSCIGQSFARAELACLIAAWVDRFDTSFAVDHEKGQTQGDLNGGERYMNGVKVVTGISAKPGNLKVKIVEAERT